jgi:tetratricopeptide (TPR) repeat protein
MTPEQTRSLIDRFDENFAGGLYTDTENLAGNDAETLQELSYLRVAVDAVKDAGLHEKVSVVRASWKEAIKPSGGVVRSINRYSLRAAAIILIVASSTAIYKYASVSSNGLYDRYYSSYSLHTTRGEGAARPIEQAYEARDWQTVISLAATAKQGDNQTDFLAGIAGLELKKYDDAITHFEQVIAVNAHAGTTYYQDEAEYYLAISWLAMKNVNEAMPILEKIKADPQHKYHDRVAKMSFFDLRLVQYKENK